MIGTPVLNPQVYEILSQKINGSPKTIETIKEWLIENVPETSLTKFRDSNKLDVKLNCGTQTKYTRLAEALFEKHYLIWLF